MADAKKKKVRFIDMIRAEYGAFDPGDVAEIPEGCADALVKARHAEEVRDSGGAKKDGGKKEGGQ